MPTASPEQLKASDPARSVWVSANAGAGKTTVLTGRVIRLLLAGADPARILCVTFTKAAAANMQNRVFRDLGEWVALDDAALAEAISALEGRVATPDDLTRARRLFARAVETPGGLKIQTIHGFAERLLHHFPFESGVPARFEVLDDATQARLNQQAVSSVLAEAIEQPDGALGRALTVATADVGEDSFRTALRQFMQHRRRHGGGAPEQKFASSALRTQLGVKAGETVDALDQELFTLSLYTKNWREIADWLAKGKPTDVKRADALTKARRTQGDEDRDLYLSVFLTEARKPFASIATKDLKIARPDLEETMLQEQERVHGLLQKRRAVAAAIRTEAMIQLADAALVRFRAEKRRNGSLDFDDLIAKAVALLTSDAAAWVRYKLDQGLDHVLVDEAQDTSPDQWAIIKALSAEFFAGAGARGAIRRTIFAVGDEKQSIFGFQGAKPEEFDAARQYYKREIDTFNADADKPHAFEKVPLVTSYRTVPDVLSFVDQVFSIPTNFGGISSDNIPTTHESNRLREPGLVELWEPVVGEKEEIRDATDPVDALPDAAPAMQLARRTASRIAHWLKTGARFADDEQLIGAGDVLVLVRNRGAIFDSVIKALKQAGVPVAGADRMKLKEQIAVLDLLAAGRFCLLPEDDLNLAALLKSPLIGLDEDQLFVVAEGRGSISLWQALCDKAGDDANLAAAHRLLSGWLDVARRRDSFGFYAHLLAAEGGRRKLLAQLGPDAAEAIDVFMATLRQWQSANPPSLLRFIETIAESDADVKRDMEEAHGRVRVMTVHGSKGLEARIVFLLDLFATTTGGQKTPRLIPLGDEATVVWSPRSGEDPPVITEARQELVDGLQAEQRRLLYVGLTRARDRLYIAGARGQRNVTDSWQDLINQALDAPKISKADAQLQIDVPDEQGEGVVRRWFMPGWTGKAAKSVTAKPAPDAPPDWLHEPASVEPQRLPPLRPSRLSDAAEPAVFSPAAVARQEARLRGDLIHLLLQHLPELPVERRSAAAQALASSRFRQLTAEQRSEGISAAIGLLDDPRFNAVFGSAGRSEIDVAGIVRVGGRDIEVSGRIDRLAVTASEVLIIDYKTGQPPADPKHLPASYRRQLAVYATLLGDIYPDKTVTPAILWTDAAEIVPMTPAAVADALADLGIQYPIHQLSSDVPRM
jgi:ATP-dependent helicase/nuclease subunit A